LKNFYSGNALVFAITSHDATTSTVRENRNPWFHHDMIHRTVADVSTIGFSIQSWDTNIVNIQIAQWCADQSRNVEILKTVVKAQHRQIQYQSYHTAYVMGSLSEADFETESDAFVCEQLTMEPSAVADVVSRLDQLLELKFEDSELAEYFQIELASVIEGRSLAQSHIAPPTPFFPGHFHLNEITR
jgi:precorrin-6B methylase 1